MSARTFVRFTQPLLYQESLRAQADVLEQEMKLADEKRDKILQSLKAHYIKEQLKEKIAKQMQ